MRPTVNNGQRWTPRLDILTLALDAEPFIEAHLCRFERLRIPWTWHVVEGVAKNVACTRWCRPLPPRVSKDGTHEYLKSLSKHPNVVVHSQPSWEGKVAMCNHALKRASLGGVLLQIDADEFWSSSQLEKIVAIFERETDLRSMSFRCRYFVGKHIVVSERGSIHTGIWHRAWRAMKGARFQTHEPPILLGANGSRIMSADEAYGHGLFFDHFAYALESQVRFKEAYYGYPNAVAQWKSLQANKQWPVWLRKFMPWAGEASYAQIFEGRPL